jgi:hypothetical protein
MNYLILGGESQQNGQWVRGLTDAMHPIAGHVNFLDYRHWAAETAGPINVETEIDRFARLAGNYDNYAVIAKSIGTVVTALANARGLVRPERCFFLGFPLKTVETEFPEVEQAVPKLPPTTFIQNLNDPLGRFFRVRDYVRKNNPERDDFDYKQIPGATHDYPDFGLVARLVQEASS